MVGYGAKRWTRQRYEVESNGGHSSMKKKKEVERLLGLYSFVLTKTKERIRREEEESRDGLLGDLRIE